jgi:hypothetical protein
VLEVLGEEARADRAQVEPDELAQPAGAWIALGSRDSGDLGVLDVRGVALGEV